MKEFAALLDRLHHAPGDEAKVALLGRYFRDVGDPERGWGLALLTGALDLRAVKPAAIGNLVAERTDPVLFDLSHDYVGDFAETCALLWPERPGTEAPRLASVVAGMRGAGRGDLPAQIARWLDGLDAGGRWTLIKIVTGALRSGVSARLAKTALAEAFGKPRAAIEEIWHGLEAPYAALFAWLEGAAARPEPALIYRVLPFMRARPLEELADLDCGNWQIEWKWDGIRVQLVTAPNGARLYSQAGDDISAAFPEVINGQTAHGVIDGELLVRGGGGEPAPLNQLQRRLSRKSPSAKLRQQYPAFVRAYDLLFSGNEDVRGRPLLERRRALEELVAAHPHPHLDLSPILPVAGSADLARLQADARRYGRAGLMLKRLNSAYQANNSECAWCSWKREPLSADMVLMYAEREDGLRNPLFSRLTFGVWRGDELVPVGKTCFNPPKEELARLDRWIRDNTVERFGPVCAVAKSLVLGIAFDSVLVSTRHKSGLALHTPCISAIRWGMQAAGACQFEALRGMLGPTDIPPGR